MRTIGRPLYKTIGRVIGKGAQLGSKLNPSWEVNVYMQGLSTPLSSAQEEKLRVLVVALKEGLKITKLSDAFDVMYILANETAEAGLRNIVKRAHDATAVNSPSFTSLEGFKGNGKSSYLNTNYNAFADGIKFTLNNASLSAYARQMHTSGAKTFFGVTNGSDPFTIYTNYRANVKYMALNSTSASKLSADITDLGLHLITREAANITKALINGTEREISTAGSTSIANGNVYIFAANSIGNVADTFSEAQLSLFFAGRAFSLAESAAITDAFEAYMDSNGKGVIS